jgi:uncharacterized protein YciI
MKTKAHPVEEKPMKQFIVEITYTAADELIAAARPAHRVFLQSGYERGWLLMSGPRTACGGGIVVARAPSLEELSDFFQNDPYRQQGLATHQFIQFEPAKRQAFLEEWLTA